MIYSYEEKILEDTLRKFNDLNLKYIGAVNNLQDEKQIYTVITNMNDTLEYFVKFKSYYISKKSGS